MSLKVTVTGIFLLVFSTISLADDSNLLTATKQVIKVNVDLVLITVTVSNANGRVVTGLGPENFEVWEDKVEQKIEYVSQEEVPLNAGIIFDASGSMEENMSRARDAAHAFLTAGDRDDEYFLVEFSNEPKLSDDFETDVSRLQSHFIFVPAHGRTALFDAVYLGLEKLKVQDDRRKALLLITDGEDNHSRYTFSDIKEFAKERDVQIFAIGTIDDGAWRFNGRSTIEDLVAITGGAAFFPKSGQELERVGRQITEELKGQYVIGYRSTNEAKNGKWRKIHVKVNPPKGMSNIRVRAKSGYYAPSSERTQ